MTDENDPFDGVEPLEIEDVEVYGFRCDNCGGEAVPVEGFGTECPHCDSGHLTERTAETYTVRLSAEQVDEYADAVLVN